MYTHIRFLFMELWTPAGLKSLKCHTDKHEQGKIIHKCTIYRMIKKSLCTWRL